MRHRHPDDWVDQCTVDRRAPVDDIEPLVVLSDAVRDARVKCIRLMNGFAAHIEAALVQYGAPKEVLTAFYQPCYAMGLNLCEGETVTSRAEHIGVERATLSKGMVAFCVGHDLPPSQYMRSEEARTAYRTERVQRVIRGANKNR